MDERNVNVIRKICTRLYIMTMALLVLDIFYRVFVLGQKTAEKFEDLAIILTANVVILIPSLLYYGGFSVPVKKIKPLQIVLFYIGFVLAGTIFTAVKYGVGDVPFLLSRVGIIAAICSIFVAVWLVFAYFGNRKIEKELED